MTTAGELIEALQKFPATARVAVEVSADTYLASCEIDEFDPASFEVDTVRPVGCNRNDLQITLGAEI
jgi:hypothetical protein